MKKHNFPELTDVHGKRYFLVDEGSLKALLQSKKKPISNQQQCELQEESKANIKLTPGELVAHLRQEHNLSQRELSRISGICYPTISKIETGKVVPRKATLKKLMSHLKKI